MAQNSRVHTASAEGLSLDFRTISGDSFSRGSDNYPCLLSTDSIHTNTQKVDLKIHVKIFENENSVMSGTGNRCMVPNSVFPVALTTSPENLSETKGLW